jgi:hypothetical protein
MKCLGINGIGGGKLVRNLGELGPQSLCTKMLLLKTWPINLVFILLADDVYYMCSSFVYHMEVHMARRIKVHDIKLWEHDEVHAHDTR